MIDLLVRNGIIVTVNKTREIIWNGAMAVNDGKILEIGECDAVCGRYKEAGKVIDATGKVIYPGFVNTHTHLFQSLLKGLGDDMILSQWLRTMTFPAAEHLTEEDCYTAAVIGCIEGLHSGITTNLDYMYPHGRPNYSDGVIKAFKELKLRGIFGRGCMDCGTEFGVPRGIMQSKSEIEKDITRLFKTYHNSENGRLKIWAAPAAAWSNSKELLVSLYNIAKENNSGFTIHTSETPFDREAAVKLHGCADAELLQEFGIAGPNVLMVHCVYLNERDLRMAQYYDMKVSHNTVSNMYLSSGVAPVPQMLQAGITVGLGVDGAASNNSQDMLELMKCTALLHKAHTTDPTVITAEKVLEMATINGAKAVGLENEIGSLEKGKKADFIIFNPLLSSKSVPMHNPVSTLVYSSSQQNIETVAVDGNILLDDGVITAVPNEKAVLIEGQRCAERLAVRGNITNRMNGHRWRSSAF